MDEFTLNAADVDKVTNAIEDIVNSMTRMSAEREYITEVTKMLKEKYGIPTPVSREAASVLLKPEKKEKAETKLDMVDYLVELTKN